MMKDEVPGGGELAGETAALPSSWPVFVHYLIARREVRGLELPHIILESGEEILPVFSSRQAAQRFLSHHDLGDGWYVRQFSTGELVSLLFALHDHIKQVLPNPLPEHPLKVDEWTIPVSWDRFMELLIAS